MVKKHLRLIVSIVEILIVVLFLCRCASGWVTVSHNFSGDENGKLAKNFFPDYQLLPSSIKSEFEHMASRYFLGSLYGEKVYDYESYYLKLVFESSAEYEQFLEETEKNYSDMTLQQRNKAHARIHESRFKVGHYSFRAIDVSPFGPVNNDYVGLIAHCDSDNTIVFLYYWDEDFGIMELEYMVDLMPSRYSKLWDDD